MKHYRDVTKAEFDAFIATYPRPLDIDIWRVAEPPQQQYNDFTLGHWPESVVAYVALIETMPEGYGPGPQPNTYRIHTRNTVGDIGR